MPFPIQYEITSAPCSKHECVIEIEPKNPNSHGIESITISYDGLNYKLGIVIRHPTAKYEISKKQELIENFRKKNLDDYTGMFHASTLEYTSFGTDSYEFTKDQCTKIIADFINAIRTTLSMSDNVETQLFNILRSVGYPQSAATNQAAARTQVQPLSSSMHTSWERIKSRSRAEEDRKQEERDMQAYSDRLGAGN